MGKSKMQPKVHLDEEMLTHLNEFYGSELPEHFLLNDCFSHPHLDLHFCNIEALMSGGVRCEYCDHVVGRRCKVTCDVYHFCLAVFAYRLGIGKGDTIWSIIKHNLIKLKYSELKARVKAVLDGEVFEEGESEVEETENKPSSEVQPVSLLAPIPEPIAVLEPPAELSLVPESNSVNKPEPKKPTLDDTQGVKKPKAAKKKAEKSEVKPEKVEKEVNITEDDDLLDYKAAANLYGCKPYNIYCHAKRGSLGEVIKSGGKHYVRRSEVEALKVKVEANRKKSRHGK